MKAITIFLYEFKHFIRSKAKVFAYLLFLFASVYAVYSGLVLEKRQKETLKSIEQKTNEDISKVLTWYQEGKKGPEDSPWVDINTPFWALWNLPTYAIKEPSPSLPLGVGQTEQYGYYKDVTIWSSVYDKDMVEELANPERLVIGNIDFAFLVIFLLPILFIILTYNIYGFERDMNFDKLIAIQSRSTKNWILQRISFYTLFLIATVAMIVIFVGITNDVTAKEILSLILLSSVYIAAWALIFYFIILNSKSSNAIAFKMISVWLFFCVLLPGAVHQMASIKYPANYMTNYLDASRKELYEVFDFPPDTLAAKMKNIYPDLVNTIQGKDSIIDAEIINETGAAIANQINKKAIGTIESRNDAKNRFIRSSYWYNPISMIQNKWNSITGTDYTAYKSYRDEVQKSIDMEIELLVFEIWDKKKVDKKAYEKYLNQLK